MTQILQDFLEPAGRFARDSPPTFFPSPPGKKQHWMMYYDSAIKLAPWTAVMITHMQSPAGPYHLLHLLL